MRAVRTLLNGYMKIDVSLPANGSRVALLIKEWMGASGSRVEARLAKAT